jgi:hypothetical protein
MRVIRFLRINADSARVDASIPTLRAAVLRRVAIHKSPTKPIALPTMKGEIRTYGQRPARTPARRAKRSTVRRPPVRFPHGRARPFRPNYEEHAAASLLRDRAIASLDQWEN